MADMETEIVEFLDGDTLKIGLVLKRNASRVQITDQNGKQHSLNSRQILLFHDKKVSSSEFNEFNRSYLEAVKTLSKEIDTELLWESLEGKGSELKPDNAAEIYFGNSETISQSAILSAVGTDSIHFKRKGNHIIIRDSHHVEEQEHVLKKRAERHELNDRFITWSSDLLNEETAQPPGCPQEFLPFLNSLEQALSNEGYILEPWLKELIKHHSGPFRSRAETIVLLLVGGDRLPENADPFILESGVPLEFTEAALEEAGNITPYESAETESGVESNLIFSVDDEGTEEIDDAVSITEIDNNYLIGIHIADTSNFVPPDSLLDQEASVRYTSIYLPHRQIRMLPEELSCDLMSLRENQLRPVVSCNLLVSPDLEILEWNFSRNFLTVNKNLTYTQTDTLIRSASSAENLPGLRNGLQVLKGFTDRLLKKRVENGALIINRPEIKICPGDEKIQLCLLDPDSPSRLLISELMVLYNSLAADFAAENLIPFIYRAQKEPTKEIPELPSDGYDHFAAFKLFSLMEPSSMGLEPSSHFGLGLDSYTQVSSPIRRYSDLLNQRQLSSLIMGRIPVYTPEKLSECLAGIGSADRLTRNLERKINRLFTLRYLLQTNQKEFDLVILQAGKGGYQVETIPECFRGTLTSPVDLLPGTRLRARVSKIDPENDSLQFIGEF